MIAVHIPTADGRWLILPRYTQPEAEAKMILDRLKLELPAHHSTGVSSNPRQRCRLIAICGEDLPKSWTDSPVLS